MSTTPTPRTPSAVANEQATNITAYLIAGPLAYGGLGWLADRWLGTGFLTAIGVLLGVSLSLYIVYVRYGRARGAASARSIPDAPESTLNEEST